MAAMNITKYAIVLTAFLVTFGSAAQTPGGSGPASGTIPPFPAPDVVLKPSALANGHVSLSPSGTFAVYAGTANSSIIAIAFSRDGRWLAAGWNPVSLIDVWDINSRRKTQTLQAAQGGIDALAFGPDGTLLASGAEGNSVRTWNWSKEKLKSDFQGHKTYLENVAFDPSGRWLVSADNGEKAFVRDASSYQQIAELDHSRAIAFAQDGLTLVSAGASDVVFWDTGTWRVTRRLQSTQKNINCLAVHDGIDRLATGSFQWAELWELKSGRDLGKIYDGNLYSLSFSPDGRWLALDAQHALQLRDAKSGRVLCSAARLTRDANFSPDGRWLAAGVGPNVELWSTKTLAAVCGTWQQ
jgi:WD40 repeat protein